MKTKQLLVLDDAQWNGTNAEEVRHKRRGRYTITSCILNQNRLAEAILVFRVDGREKKTQNGQKLQNRTRSTILL